MARLIYLGTPELAVAPLEALVGAGHDIELVVTRPDRRRGRGTATAPSPVKAAALALGLPVTDRLDDVAGCRAELGVVVAYGRLIPGAVLAALAMVNLHFSVLPRWRGAAPVERALLAGDDETGVCVMAVEEGLDTGPLYAVRRVRVGDHDLASLRRELVTEGSALLLDIVAGGADGLPTPTPQQGTPTYAEKIRPEELELCWDRPATELARVVRLGRAWTTFRGRRLRVLEAAPVAAPAGDGAPGSLAGGSVRCGDGALALWRVQPESGRPMDAPAWCRGARPGADERLGR